MTIEFPESRRRETTSNDVVREVPRYARVLASAVAYPDNRISNQDIVDQYAHQVNPAMILKTQGVEYRRVAEDGIVDSDLLVQAARACLDSARMAPGDLSKILVTKFLGDRVLPMTAAFVQKKLGGSSATQAFDVDGGIHAFHCAFEVASCAIECGDGPILIVSGGVTNRLVTRTDPRFAFLFGDGAAAVLLGPSHSRKILGTYAYSNPEYASDVTGFCVRECVPPNIHETRNYDALYELYRPADYKRTMEFVVQAMRVTQKSLLEQAQLVQNDVDLVLVTENHSRLWLAVLDALGIETSQTISRMRNFGNTMSAMLPSLLHEAVQTARVCEGDRVMLLSVGENGSGGGILLVL